MKFFHLTRSKNIGSITTNGLLLSYCNKNGIGINSNWNPPRIFLTDNLEVPIRQLDKSYLKEDWDILEVSLPDSIKVQPHMTTCYEYNIPIPHEYVVYENIPFSCLRMFS